MIRRLLNWLSAKLDRINIGDGYVLVRLQTGHLLWFPERHYRYLCRRNTCLIWETNGSIEIIEYRWLRHYPPTNIFIASVEVQEVCRSPMPHAVNDGSPYSQAWLRQHEGHEMFGQILAQNYPTPRRYKPDRIPWQVYGF